MKKIFSLIALLVLLHIAALGTLCAVFPSNNIYNNTHGVEPDVERFEFYSDGGHGGCFHYAAKLWHDALGYHLYFKQQDGYENTFALTKLEYLRLTYITHEDVEGMSSFEGARIYDGITTAIWVKFKGEQEIYIPKKIYDTSKYHVPVRNVLEYVWNIQDGHDNEFQVKLNKSISSYLLKYNIRNYRFYYSIFHEGSNATMNRFGCYQGIDIKITKGMSAFQDKCVQNRFFRKDRESKAREFLTNDSTVLNFQGNTAYMKAKEFNGVAFFFISSSDTRETIAIIAPVPEGMSFEEFKNDICAVFNNCNNRYFLDKSVFIETFVFLGIAMITVLISEIIRYNVPRNSEKD